MISPNLIERHFEARRYDRLLDAAFGAGVDLPMILKLRLNRTMTGPIALGLRRVLEMTYGRRTVTAAAMLDVLREHQQADGSFDGDPVLTAAAAAAMAVAVDLPGRREPEWELRLDNALAALTQMQCDDGLFESRLDGDENERALVAAFILFLLGRDERFRQAVRIADLLNYFDDRRDQLDDETRRWHRLGREQVPTPLAA